MNSNRNSFIDIIKTFAAIFVVLIHFPFPGASGIAIKAIGRFAVLYFFMVSGYYCYSESYNYKLSLILRKTWHIVKIFFIGAAIYIGYNIFSFGFEYIRDFFIAGEIKWNVGTLLLFNNPILSHSHLWFLLALAYTYLVFYVMSKIAFFNTNRRYIFIIVALLAINITMQSILPRFGYSFNVCYYRNCWLTGFPFFLTGNLIRRNRNKMVSCIHKPILVLIVLCGVILSVVAAIVFNPSQRIYIGSYLIVIPLFMLSVAYEVKRYDGFLSWFGRECTLYLYIIHPLVGGGI